MPLFFVLAQGRGGVNVQGLLEVIVFILVFFSSAIGWALKKLKERMAAQRTERATMLERQEMLRTGKAFTPVQPLPQSKTATQDEAVRRLQELARRRREELEALARQAQQAARAKGTAPPLPSTPRPAPPPRRVELPPELQRGLAMPKRPVPRPQPIRPAPAVKPQPARPAAKKTPTSQVDRTPPAEAPREAPSSSEVGVATGVGLAGLVQARGDLSALRRAVLLSEVLGTPIGLREQM